MSIHDRIRDARENANLSVNAFAKKVGVSSTAAWNWDWGYTTPKPDRLSKIAQVLGVSVDYLKGANVAPAPSPSDGSESLDAILQDAANRIGNLLRIAPDRVQLDFKLKS